MKVVLILVTMTVTGIDKQETDLNWTWNQCVLVADMINERSDLHKHYRKAWCEERQTDTTTGPLP